MRRELDYTLREEDEFTYLPIIWQSIWERRWPAGNRTGGSAMTWMKGLTAGAGKKLPRVGYVMTVISQLAKGINDLFLGRDCNNMMPLLAHPQEILDGFLLGGIGLAGQALTTYDAQNHPMIKRLCQEHGKTIDFAGLSCHLPMCRTA